ncbi:MAG: Fur family transcriptional regulator [Paracoccaceae bacterium]
MSDPATNTAHDRASVWLAGAGLRPTRQRLALASLLVGDGQDRHVTAESLFHACRASAEPVSLATVYNTLRAFRDAGLLAEITVDGARSYFDTRIDDHPHFYWEDSQELTDAGTGRLHVEGLPEAPEGADVARVDVIIRLRGTRSR